ncbi:MAG: alanine racemase [Chloroflexota bacterium]
MFPNRHFSNWLEVDLTAIAGNVQQCLARTGVAVMAVVKANAYGHGLVPVAKAAQRAGAGWCGVARVDEALELRQAGVDGPILILGATPFERMEQAVTAGVSMAVWEAAQVEAARTAAARAGQPARLHLKVDTGMTRLGIEPEAAEDLAHRIAATPGVELEGIFTHFARADERDPRPTEAQESLFRQVTTRLQEVGLRPPLVHAANSAAGLTRPSAWFDMVRIGIAMYGLDPSTECRLPDGFRPALSWKTVLTQVRRTPAGRGVSYGHTYVTRGEERVGVAPVGYGDGYRRVAGNQVLVGGRLVPVVGRVCMDQIMIQLDDVPEARPGDEVVLIGEQGGARLTAEKLAERWGTFNYEVVCGLSARVTRLYFGQVEEPPSGS